jgi:hypothetical protein
MSTGTPPFGAFTLTQPDFPRPYPIASTYGRLFAYSSAVVSFTPIT